jgi:hypothetical protein
VASARGPGPSHLLAPQRNNKWIHPIRSPHPPSPSCCYTHYALWTNGMLEVNFHPSKAVVNTRSPKMDQYLMEGRYY